MNQLQESLAIIWHSVACPNCRRHLTHRIKGYKRVNTKTYRKQAIERRKKLQAKLDRRNKLQSNLTNKDYQFLFTYTVIMLFLVWYSTILNG